MSFEKEGFELVRNVFSAEELEVLRDEADRVARDAGATCVRNLREKSSKFERLATSACLLRLLPDGVVPVRSILFDKNAESNWPVTWHQDLTIAVAEKCEVSGYGPWSLKDGAVHVQPPESLLREMVTIRIHLDDTPESNGALRVIPGTHLKGKMESKDVIKCSDTGRGYEIETACRVSLVT